MSTGTGHQIILNISSSSFAYILSVGISFFLTPYIVSKLGTAAFGFVGLSNNIINYTILFTIALNSMSVRYIALHYHKNEIELSREYLSSTFFANLFIGSFLILLMGCFIYFLDDFLSIPTYLVTDVKFLFLLLFINSILGLITNVYSVSTFIPNRIDLANLQSMIGTIIRSVVLLILFILFKPELWFFGISAILMTVYTSATNLHYYKIFTPNLSIRFRQFQIRKVFEMVKSGSWNVVSSLSTILNEGLDLVLANIFISPNAMGVLSISKIIPNFLLSFVIALVGSFNPDYMRLYATNDTHGLKNRLLQVIRLLSFICTIPIVIIIAYSDIFFKCWLPSEDSELLYHLSIISSVLLIFALPYQSLWYIFVLYNKVKRSSINALINSLITICLVIICMYVSNSDITKLILLVSTRTCISSFRCVTFLPIYASKVMALPRNTFYKPIIFNTIFICSLTLASIVLKYVIHAQSWTSLLLLISITGFIGYALGFHFILNRNDREYIRTFIQLKKISAKI